MRIAIDCRYWGKSGIGTFIRNAVTLLIKHYPANQYLLIGEESVLNSLKAENVTVQNCDIVPFSLKELFCFPTMQINQCDIFFSPYINIPLGIKIRVVSTIHDVIFWDLKKLVSSVGLFLRSLYLKHAIRVSDAVLTVSEFSKERILQNFNCTKPIFVVYNTLSEQIKVVDKSDLPNQKQNYILFIGNIKPHKGLKTLVEAFDQVETDNLNLVLVGESHNFRTSDDRMLSELADNPRVKFTGRISDGELIRYLANAKVLVSPSLYEGFGLPPLESLYLGTNVVISNIPVYKELYENLPVMFFEVDNSADLKAKLLEEQMPLNVDLVRSVIDGKYGDKAFAERIMNVLNNI